MNLKLLRDSTRPEHEATESIVSLMEPGLTRAMYADVLCRFYAVVSAWETVAARSVPAAYAELVRARGRGALLAADLTFLGEDPAAVAAPAELVDRIAALVARRLGDADADREADSRFLGAMYVMEGSTLGGRYIAAHLETALELPLGEGNRFFRGYEEQTMPMWREFQAALLALPDELGDTVIRASKEMFGIFAAGLTGPVAAPSVHQAANAGTTGEPASGERN